MAINHTLHSQCFAQAARRKLRWLTPAPGLQALPNLRCVYAGHVPSPRSLCPAQQLQFMLGVSAAACPSALAYSGSSTREAYHSRACFTRPIPAPRSLLRNADTAHPTCGLADSLLFLNVGGTNLATFCAHRFFLRSKRTLFIIAVDVNALSTSESFELPIPIAAYFARSAAGMPFSCK